MKIKDITEGLYDTLTGASQKLKQAAWASGGAKEYYAKQRADQAQALAQQQSAQASISQNQPSQFMKQWKLTDPDLGIVQYGNTQFQRDETGAWVDFRTGKPVPQRFIPALDQVLPPTATKAKPQDIPGAWYGQRPKPKTTTRQVPMPAVVRPNPARG